MSCSVLQYVAVCCSMLQCVAVFDLPVRWDMCQPSTRHHHHKHPRTIFEHSRPLVIYGVALGVLQCVLQHVAACCSMLQHTLQHTLPHVAACCNMLCSMLQCIADQNSVWLWVGMRCWCVAVCCAVLQCVVAECCSVLQCIAVYCNALACAVDVLKHT